MAKSHFVPIGNYIVEQAKNCVIKVNGGLVTPQKITNIEMLNTIEQHLIDKGISSISLDPEFSKTIDEHFWDLI